MSGRGFRARGRGRCRGRGRAVQEPPPAPEPTPVPIHCQTPPPTHVPSCDNSTTAGSTTGKMENIIHEVENEATVLSQHQSSAADDDSVQSSEPTVVEKSQIFMEKIGKQKGRMIGLGNLGKARRVGSSSLSRSSEVIYATQSTIDEIVNARVSVVQQEFQQREEQLWAELTQLKSLVDQLVRGGGVGGSNATGGSNV